MHFKVPPGGPGITLFDLIGDEMPSVAHGARTQIEDVFYAGVAPALCPESFNRLATSVPWADWMAQEPR